MNLSAYDSMTPNFTKTWIVPANRKLYSYEMDFYHYYTFLKRYNPNNRSNDYYIALSNNITEDKVWFTTYQTNSKAITINLRPIWNESNFSKFRVPEEISLSLEEVFEDGIVYYIDI
ncbi:MAG: hypothetical protein K2M17_05275 [Bacilli bacterium]|nr:hypothetical protein [Bacilli bacterium]